MSNEDPGETFTMVPGRTCGACTVCCVVLTIDDPELQKLQGYRCRHILQEGACAIYDSRPASCRKFYCGWRLLKWVGESLRPDLSGVLVRLYYLTSEARSDRGMGMIVTLLNRGGLKANGLAETMAAAVTAGVPLFLEIPGPPGYTAGKAQMNEALSDAVQTKDKPALLSILRRAYSQGKRGNHQPVRLTHRS